MRTRLPLSRVAEWFAFYLVAGTGIFLWLWRGGVMEVEDEFGEPQMHVAVLAAAVLAGSGVLGYATKSWGAVLGVAIAPVPVLVPWQVVVTISDGTVWWDPESYGGPALLYVYAVPVALSASVGVVLGHLRQRAAVLLT